MILPKLRVLQDAPQKDATTCMGKDNCSSCALFKGNGGRCGGCTASHKALLADNFKWCHQECHGCAGYGVTVTAICCRSPLKDTYLTAVAKGSDWNHPQYTFKKRATIRSEQKAVFYITAGGLNSTRSDEGHLVDDVDLVAVNLTRVWGNKGFFSKDLKDYLHLPKSARLVLMTMSLDDILERAWEAELYADPYELRSVGLDAWMPIAFSAFNVEPRMHQYYQYLRMLYTAEKSEAWFYSGNYRKVGLDIDDLAEQAIAAMPQVVFNAQFTADEEQVKATLLNVRWHHQHVPAHVPFWLVGSSTPTFVHNARKVCGDRDLYFLSSRPFFAAAKGGAFDEHGKVHPGSPLSRPELVRANYEAYSRIVAKHGAAKAGLGGENGVSFETGAREEEGQGRRPRRRRDPG